MGNSKVILVSPEKVNMIKEEFRIGGKEKIHILADFDRTLTKCFSEGNKITGSFARIRQGNYLGEDYVNEAQDMFEFYHPIELDQKKDKNFKKESMVEWWKKHLLLLIKNKISKKIFGQVVKEDPLIFREGYEIFFSLLKSNKIPLVIISAGLGDLVFFHLKEKSILTNTFILSNFFIFNKKGIAEKIKPPIIHSFNKDETIIRDFPEVFSKVKERKNVILLGDGPEDVGMIEGFDYDNLLKIGFLNENIKENIEEFKKVFDVIITNDGSFDFINKFLLEVIK